jgi:hypothetical protein
MRKEISEYKDFEHDGWTVQLDLSTAYMEYHDDVVVVEGNVRNENENKEVYVHLSPVNLTRFNNMLSESVSSGDGNSRGQVTGECLRSEATLECIESRQ